MFVKEQVSTCDYFVALMGTWAPTSSKLLIISIYDPQELNERRDLWDYLRMFIDRWEGDTVIMSDFNEVRLEHERFGFTFNRQGAIAFNNFISLACLIDLPLEGYAFTWAHKSASKMSKLDRYLISEGVLYLFPHLSALCLDQHLFDHRPILLRETNYDYGPSPFWFFHSWFAMEGFNSFVETTWKSLNIMEPNGLIQLKKKLQALKIAIKAWSKEANKRSNDRKINIQQNLSEVDKLIDQGKSSDEILIKRVTLLNDLQELNNRNAMEISQKAKIQWSIEGDENSKYFHGIMNKKRSQLAIRRTLANGEWISELHKVKNEFFTHFKKQFLPIQAPSICFDFTFPTRLSSDQVQDLERTITYEEESIRQNLFYGVDGSDRKLAWIGWNMVLTSKKNGAIFSNKGALDTHKLIPRRSLWQDVILAIHSLQSKGINLMDFIQKNVGNGENTSFWDDSWLGEVALKVLCKRMPRGGVEQENYDLLCSKVTDLVLPNISDGWC
uniref:RNA-directed DNA polymerase, eukaryota n=1 Tax=Tanacetum cinerariifolium TaxID=118510 RepID=A0A6L2MLP1_TANCI|nr:RNA-directed DNA polymerase, eukaryota [Tanacetum cinerariifolium]